MQVVAGLRVMGDILLYLSDITDAWRERKVHINLSLSINLIIQPLITYQTGRDLHVGRKGVSHRFLSHLKPLLADVIVI